MPANTFLYPDYFMTVLFLLLCFIYEYMETDIMSKFSFSFLNSLEFTFVSWF
jgi:hypothetical protein